MTNRDDSTPAFEPGEYLSEPTRRRQGQMVLYALECALATYVRENVDSRGASVAKSLQAVSTRMAAQLDLGQAIPATYLDELVAMSREVSRGTASSQPADRLKLLLDTLNAYTIRNGCAHPNNPFPPHFWYALKTIASDPCIEMLKLTPVQEALGSALRGEIRPPPDDWLASIIWKLPSNLPATFEHEATGLIGRKSEREQLLRFMRDPKMNLIAVVAPGGIGKTALLLDALREISATPADSQWVDEIVWITAKTHELTAAGQRRLQPDVSIENVKSSIACALSDEGDDLSMVIKSQGDRRVLLALDNLETILRDSAQLFADLYQELPSTWRVVVTSRIQVDGARHLTLSQLQQDGAVQLANAYFRWKGSPGPRPDMTRLVQACACNPLAIRLALDGFAAGGDLGDVLTTTKKNLVQFSYQTVVERMSPLARKLLECLFVSESLPTRSELVGLLNATVDEVAETLGSLLRTSLVSRITGDGNEQYELGSGIRDLMLETPLDDGFRVQVIDRRREQSARAHENDRAQVLRNIGPLHIYFVPPTHSPAVRELASRVARALRGKGAERPELAKLRDEVVRRLDTDPNCLLHRLLAVLLFRLNDRVMALSELRSAAAGNDYDPAAVLKLAEELGRDQDFAESVRLTKQLIDDGWGDLERWGSTAGMVWGLFWKHRVWSGDFASVAGETRDWASRGELALTAGLSYAQARRRSVEYSQDPAEIVAALSDSAEAVDALFERFGVSGPLAQESSKLIHQMAYLARDVEIAVEREAQSRFSEFVGRRLSETVVAHRSLSSNVAEVDGWLFDLRFWLGEARFRELRRSVSGDTSAYATPADGKLLAAVYHLKRIPGASGETRVSSVFARGDDGTQYYVGRAKFLGTDRQWSSLRPNDVLLVEPDSPVPGRSAVPVLSAEVPNSLA